MSECITARFLDPLPEVLRDAVGEQMLLEVNRDTFQELILANVYRQHAED